MDDDTLLFGVIFSDNNVTWQGETILYDLSENISTVVRNENLGDWTPNPVYDDIAFSSGVSDDYATPSPLLPTVQIGTIAPTSHLLSTHTTLSAGCHLSWRPDGTVLVTVQVENPYYCRDKAETITFWRRESGQTEIFQIPQQVNVMSTFTIPLGWTEINIPPTADTDDSTGIESDADITAFEWHPNGQQLAVGYEDGQLDILDADTMQVIMSLSGADEKIYTIAWRHDAQQLAASGEYTAWVWDAMTGQILSTLPNISDGFTLDIIWTMDSDEILIYAYDSTFSLWDANTFDLIGRSGSSVRIVKLNPDNTLVGYGGAGGLNLSSPQGLHSSVRFDPNLTQPIFSQRLEYSGPFSAIAWSSDGQSLAGGGGGNLLIWGVIQDEIILNIEALTDEETFMSDRGFSDKFIRDVAFSAGDTQISAIARMGIFRTWDVATGALVAETILPNKISAAAFSPDGTQLVYAFENGGSTFNILPVPRTNTPPTTADADP